MQTSYKHHNLRGEAETLSTIFLGKKNMIWGLNQRISTVIYFSANVLATEYCRAVSAISFIHFIQLNNTRWPQKLAHININIKY